MNNSTSYEHLFFDLDRTLWDFETNSHETLLELHDKHNLADRGITQAEEFIFEYKRINELCWADYRLGKIDKQLLRHIRFRKALEHFKVKDEALAEVFGAEYIALCPLKNTVFPDTHDVLDYLVKKYRMHIITNGFEEVQYIKMKHSNLTDYFDVVVVSEAVGEKKPHPKVFDYALEQTGAKAAQSLMIGDDLPVDIMGAQACGIHGVYFNPHDEQHSEDPTYEIKGLKELKLLL